MIDSSSCLPLTKYRQSRSDSASIEKSNYLRVSFTIALGDDRGRETFTAASFNNYKSAQLQCLT